MVGPLLMGASIKAVSYVGIMGKILLVSSLLCMLNIKSMCCVLLMCSRVLDVLV